MQHPDLSWSKFYVHTCVCALLYWFEFQSKNYLFHHTCYWSWWFHCQDINVLRAYMCEFVIINKSYFFHYHMIVSDWAWWFHSWAVIIIPKKLSMTLLLYYRTYPSILKHVEHMPSIERSLHVCSSTLQLGDQAAKLHSRILLILLRTSFSQRKWVAIKCTLVSIVSKSYWGLQDLCMH